MIINSHELNHAADAGNGYHGNCKHCGLPLVTDLGYVSWKGVECVDREITSYNDMPNEIKAYANFRGFKWNQDKVHFVKPYSDETYTIDQLDTIIKNIKQKINDNER